MAKPIVARKGRSRTSTPAASTRRRSLPRSAPETAALRALNPQAREILHSRLTRANAALMTAILACEKSGVFDEVSQSLRAHVYFPLRDLMDAIDGKEPLL